MIYNKCTNALTTKKEISAPSDCRSGTPYQTVDCPLCNLCQETGLELLRQINDRYLGPLDAHDF